MIEEEREFLASRWEYSSDAMLAASQVGMGMNGSFLLISGALKFGKKEIDV